MTSKISFSPEVWRKQRRKGISIVECIILLVIVSVTIGAIMQTIAWSIGLQTFSREDLGIHIFVNNWFEALESLPPSRLGMGNSDLEDASVPGGKIVDQVKARMGRASPYKYEASRAGPVNGTYTIRLEVWPSSKQRSSRVVLRDINTFSTATAPDNSEHD
ncbi:MAG: hypothetical protein LBQ42_07055 [Synergistaceae bacterium]|jgi:hypothetical protein|nr:hypothetical protein [Synergistaceae bacterium]